MFDRLVTGRVSTSSSAIVLCQLLQTAIVARLYMSDSSLVELASDSIVFAAQACETVKGVDCPCATSQKHVLRVEVLLVFVGRRARRAVHRGMVVSSAPRNFRGVVSLKVVMGVFKDNDVTMPGHLTNLKEAELVYMQERGPISAGKKAFISTAINRQREIEEERKAAAAESAGSGRQSVVEKALLKLAQREEKVEKELVNMEKAMKEIGLIDDFPAELWPTVEAVTELDSRLKSLKSKSRHEAVLVWVT